jgi:hypothetical protein
MDVAPVRIVEVSVSPDHTWIAAPSADIAWFVREAVSAAGLTYAYARQGGRIVEQIVDLGASVSAQAACEALARMGVRFRWHMDQDPAKGEGWQRALPGSSREGSILRSCVKSLAGRTSPACRSPRHRTNDPDLISFPRAGGATFALARG